MSSDSRNDESWNKFIEWQTQEARKEQKSMKVIDLLNKIANSEEVPEKIKYNGEIYHYGYHYQWYLSDNLCEELFIDKNHLNDEVEILEELPKEEIQVLSRWYPLKVDKKIRKIGKLNQVSNEKQHLNNYILRNKINEIIDKLNGEDNEY